MRFVRNREDPVEGYPRLQRLKQLKKRQFEQHSTKPYGCRIEPDKMVQRLSEWIYKDNLQFDVIMIGGLTENQFIYPLLTKLPIEKLCSKPGFLFIWASTKKIQELTKLLSSDANWGKKFRRSEELVFVALDESSPYYPHEAKNNPSFTKNQWHCWICITGTVRRSTDNHLIHCNVDTDLSMENKATVNSAVPPHLYKVAENFSSSTRRLHIIPSRTGLTTPVKMKPGWVVVSPDILLDNFSPTTYKKDIEVLGKNLPFHHEIESLRPKSPVC